MNITEQINNYLATLTESKSTEMNALHQRMLFMLPDCKLWFLDGKDKNGKIVSNHKIGY